MLQISGANRDKLGMIFHIIHKDNCCEPSLELSWQDCSNDRSQQALVEKYEVLYIAFD